MTKLVIEIDLDWLDRKLGVENTNKLLEMLADSNDDSRTLVCVSDEDEESYSCVVGNDGLVLDLLKSLISQGS